MAWGIMAALFMPFGWIPNDRLAKIVHSMSIFILPIVIGSSGGKLTGGIRRRNNFNGSHYGSYCII